MNNMDILMYEETNKEEKQVTLAEYIFDNYALGGSVMLVSDILKYVDENIERENKVDVLSQLLYSIGITSTEIAQFV